MYQLRTYTLQNSAALERYATVHWRRHITHMQAIGIVTHGIWMRPKNESHRLVALVFYPDGADASEVRTVFMAGSGFAADMNSFDVNHIVDVSTILRDPTVASPLV